jgi:hypothetical protein
VVTRHGLPDWEVDDRPFHAALTARGIVWDHVPWDHPTYDWSVVDVALLRTPWDYQARLPEFLAWLRRAASLTRVEHDVDVVTWNSRKTYLRDLADARVPVAPTRWWSPGDDVDLGPLLRAAGWTRAFLKPVVGASASDTLRFAVDAEGLAAAAAHLTAVNAPMIVQPYLATVETLGEWSAIVIDGQLTHGVRKVPVPGDYRVQDDYGAKDEPLAPTPELVALTTLALEAAAARLRRTTPLLYARVDVLHHDGRLVLNELEVIEPSLFFRHGAHAAEALVDALVRRHGHRDARAGSVSVLP